MHIIKVPSKPFTIVKAADVTSHSVRGVSVGIAMTVVWHVDDAVTIDIVTKRDIPVTLPSVFASIVQSEILQKTPDLLTLSGPPYQF
ncbi:hypothetical protein T05_6484 [Trichinella murrelli]|uniref:Uncharacterized protein n=1 Tax=Trichinella murrelli TaxID=144512 RepID=A0A0V0T3E1_9BILA|nr:hypothetical protein T05_6484 [Trichinella murrelli]